MTWLGLYLPGTSGARLNQVAREEAVAFRSGSRSAGFIPAAAPDPSFGCRCQVRVEGGYYVRFINHVDFIRLGFIRLFGRLSHLQRKSE